MTNSEMKELLELAAKACGKLIYFEEEGVISVGENTPSGFALWNPLTDDGDYSRMEALLRIDSMWLHDHVWVAAKENGRVEYYADHNNDKQAARRVAGTRLAAEIGRTMK